MFYLSFLAYANDKGMNHGVYIGLGDKREDLMKSKMKPVNVKKQQERF
jgi:hypothetical protein